MVAVGAVAAFAHSVTTGTNLFPSVAAVMCYWTPHRPCFASVSPNFRVFRSEPDSNLLGSGSWCQSSKHEDCAHTWGDMPVSW